MVADNLPSSPCSVPWVRLVGAIAAGAPSTSCQRSAPGASQARNSATVISFGGFSAELIRGTTTSPMTIIHVRQPDGRPASGKVILALPCPTVSAKVPPSQPPGAGESGPVSAAEGATGPRKRSGNRDRAGNRDLWKADSTQYARRTDGVRDRSPESLRFRDRGGSRRRYSAGGETLRGDLGARNPSDDSPGSMAQTTWRPNGAVRRLFDAGAIRLTGEFAERCKGGVMAEHLHCREQAALFDVSHMGQAMLHGPNAASALERLVCGDIAGLKPGRNATLC